MTARRLLLVLAFAVAVPTASAVVVPTTSSSSSAPRTDPDARADHSRARWLAELRHAAALRATWRTLAARAREVAEWTPIATCEEGGWIGYAGPAFPDSLGITATNWRAYGGGSDLRPFVQAHVAERIENPAPQWCPW